MTLRSFGMAEGEGSQGFALFSFELLGSFQAHVGKRRLGCGKSTAEAPRRICAGGPDKQKHRILLSSTCWCSLSLKISMSSVLGRLQGIRNKNPYERYGKALSLSRL